jgi:hypothetical protein
MFAWIQEYVYLCAGVHPFIADAIVGQGDRKKTAQSLQLSISDAGLLSAIDRMTFDKGDTEIFVKISSSNQEGGPLGALDQKFYKLL